jgi:hypothetical protein
LKKKIKVVFNFYEIEVVFNFYEIEVVFNFYEIEVVFNFHEIEVVFHILSRWGKIMLHTQNQLPRLPRTAQIVMIPGVVVLCGVVWCGMVFLTDNNTNPTKIVLSCFGLLVGLWQL